MSVGVGLVGGGGDCRCLCVGWVGRPVDGSILCVCVRLGGWWAGMCSLAYQVIAPPRPLCFLPIHPNRSALQVLVNVTDVNEPPMIPSGQTLAVAEDIGLAEMFGSVIAVDEDGDAVSFSLGAASTEFTLLPDGSVSARALLDFEATEQYQLRVVASDPSGLFSTGNVTVVVVDANDLPVFVRPSVSALVGLFNVSEAATVGFVLPATMLAADADEMALTARGFAARLVYGLSLPVGACAEALAVNPNSGAIQVTAAGRLDFETLPMCVGTASVADPSGVAVTHPIQILVTDVNETPAFVCAGVDPWATTASAPCVTLSVSEAAVPGSEVNPSAPLVAVDPDAGNTVQYTLLTASVPFFLPNPSSGVLTLNGSLDYESTRSYVMRVSARDALSASSTVFVLVNILDVNEPPVFLASLSAPVRVSKTADVGYEVLRLNAQDPEGTTLSYAITAASSTGSGPVLTLANARAMFAIDSVQQGRLTVANVGLYTVYPTGDVLSLTVAAADTSAQTASVLVTLLITAANLPPVVTPAQSRSVLENSAVNAVVGSPIAAVEPSAQPLTFALAATAAFPGALAWLSIVPGTGQLLVAKAGLDFEDPSIPTTFTVLVTVSNGVLTGSGLVSVTVVDVPEAAVCVFPTGPAFLVPENSAGLDLAAVACGGVSAPTVLRFSIWRVRLSRVLGHAKRGLGCSQVPVHWCRVVSCRAVACDRILCCVKWCGR